ncbi:MAG: MATE family efflux transporter [Gemmatimonadetes bacterium]|jgi:putative MATE family efflux protein|nr:MATE family efflux transporter [Gemmatimonadota bacterium]MBT6145297.1 MATE family efflux transporter [Gemmatimonadota bacterium]MBT7862616.1 MATE family efflux transporter [Gemmatimonadota bacterium]
MTSSPDGRNRTAEFIANPRAAVWKLSLPVMAGMGIQTLYNLTDMAFVGRLGGDAVAALTFNLPLAFFAIGIAFGLGTGATSVIARYIGANDKAGADNAAEHAIILGLAIGLGIVALALGLRVQILAMLGAQGPALDMAASYFGIVAPGFLLAILNVTCSSILSGEGDTRTPMAIQGSGTILNIILDPLFIFTADMGIRGAAAATVTSQAVVFGVFVVYILVRKKSYVEFRFRDFSPSPQVLGSLLRIGLPASASMVIMSVGGMFFNRIVSVFGTEAVAGLGVGGRMDALYILPTIALSSSQVTLCGMFLGARRIDLVRQTLRYTILWGEVLAISMGVLFWLLAPMLAGLFTEDARVIDIATGYIRTICWGFPFITIGIISGRVFQGLGSGMPSLIVTTLRVLVVSIPAAWILTRYAGFGLGAVWWCFVGSAMLSSAVAALWLRRRLRQVEDQSVTCEDHVSAEQDEDAVG